MRKIAVVTPYYKEAREVLERCLASVAGQSVAADHFLIADGYPQSWLEAQPVRHLTLDRAHDNFGNTPRAIGALLAIGEGYDAIGFLDADNWLETDHLAHCLEVAEGASDGPCDYVLAKRIFWRPDGGILEIPEGSDVFDGDTNCYLFFPGSFHMLAIWGTMPQEIAVVADRMFFRAMQVAGLRQVRATRKTVNYETLFEGTYRLAGETPPPNAKWVDFAAAVEWIDSLDPREREVAERRVGAPFRD